MEKLARKMDKRIGMRAITKDNMQTGTITGHTIEWDRVKYLICYDDKEKHLRLVDENLVVLLKDSKL